MRRSKGLKDLKRCRCLRHSPLADFDWTECKLSEWQYRIRCDACKDEVVGVSREHAVLLWRQKNREDHV